MCSVLLIECFSLPSRTWRIGALLAMPVLAALTILVVILALGESPSDWWVYSIRSAAAIKGGSSRLWTYPFRLPLGTLRELTRDWRFLVLTAYTLLVGLIAFLLADIKRKFSRCRQWLLIAGTLFLGIPLWRNFVHGNAGRVLVAFTVLAIYLSTFAIASRLYSVFRGRCADSWNPAELIILIPLGQLVSISLSAARWYPNTYPSAALFLILAPAALPWLVGSKQRRAVCYTWTAMLTLSIGIDKLRSPFDWFNYRARSVDAPRTWFQNPAFGPMLIENAQLNLFEPVCSAVNAHPFAERELLSLPFTFPNYFCNIPPWHGYTQTFYDTSSRATIMKLVQELKTAPPEWIVYQRQLDVLSRNEEAFNGGHALPHRELDVVIMQNLFTGHWSFILLPAPPHDTSCWFLIHTKQ